jgi:hypothetical protein
VDPTVEESPVHGDSAEVLMDVSRRVARLETGVRLVAETLRRVHADLSAALSDLREEVVMTATSVDVRRIVTEVVEPLAQALEDSLGTASPRLQAESTDGRPISELGPPSAQGADDGSHAPSRTEPAHLDVAPGVDNADPEWAPLPPEETSPIGS